MVNTIQFSSAWSLFHNIHKYKNDIGSNRKYSDYQAGTQRKLRRYTKSILNMLSGGDIYNLLSDLLEPHGVAKLHPFDKVSVFLLITFINT